MANVAYLPEVQLFDAFEAGTMDLRKFEGSGSYNSYYGFVDRETDKLIYAAFDQDEATDIIMWLRETAIEEQCLD